MIRLIDFRRKISLLVWDALQNFEDWRQVFFSLILPLQDNHGYFNFFVPLYKLSIISHVFIINRYKVSTFLSYSFPPKMEATQEKSNNIVSPFSKTIPLSVYFRFIDAPPTHTLTSKTLSINTIIYIHFHTRENLLFPRQRSRFRLNEPNRFLNTD